MNVQRTFQKQNEEPGPLFFWVASKSYLDSDIPLLGSITIPLLP